MPQINTQARERQRTAAQMYQNGTPRGIIASQLGVSLSTVHKYLKNVYPPDSPADAENQSGQQAQIAQSIRGNANTDLEHAQFICDSFGEALDILEDPQATPEQLMAILVSPERRITEEIYSPNGNADTSTEPDQNRTAVNYETDLLCYVIDHPSFNNQHAEQVLSEDTTESARLLAGGRYTPKEYLTALSQHSSEDVRLAAARHPNTPDDILHSLAHDSSTSVQRAVTLREHAAQTEPEGSGENNSSNEKIKAKKAAKRV